MRKVNNLKKISLVLFSPFGNTLKIGRYIQKILIEYNQYCELIDLTGKSWDEISNFDYSLIEKSNLLIIGSGVYAWKPIKPIKTFINNLPINNNGKATIFTTYGLITGYALLEGAKLLQNRGYKVLAGLKIAARHSMIFKSEDDIFFNRPNQQDLGKVRIFSKLIVKILNHYPNWELSKKKLDYYSWKVKIAYKFIIKRFGMKLLPSIYFDNKKCIKCGKCAKACPIEIIKLVPYPKKFGHCIKCYNCAWNCPVKAASSHSFGLFHFFHKILGIMYHENPETQIYL